MTSLQTSNKNKNTTLNNNKKILNKKIISLIKDPSLLKNNTTIPKYKYEGGSGFECVRFTLKPKESIQADAGALNYMSDSIEIETQTGNLTSAFSRMFSGSSFFYNSFTNTGDKDATINLSGVNPGNVGAFYIPKGQSINLVSDSYVCSTPNLKITTNVRFGGVLLGYGLTFVHIEAVDSDSIVWSSAFGNIIEKNIRPGEAIKIDNGIILGFDANTQIDTTFVGGITSTFFSGEGLVSKIENKGKNVMKMFLQSRSKSAYLDYMKHKLKGKNR